MTDEFKSILSDKSRPLNREWLDAMMAKHPYFALPALLYLQRNGIKGNEDVLARLAIATPDRQSLAMQLGDGAESFAHFYPPETEPSSPDTDTTIDRFLDSYGHASEKEIQAISNAIFNPMPDYADVLAAQALANGEEEALPQSHDDVLISKFIAESQAREQRVSLAPAQPHVEAEELAAIADAPVDEPAQTDETMFSESLAQSYIAGHNFSRALEIIEHISANNPEKSIYFADQIRFLRKLVLNEKLLNQK